MVNITVEGVGKLYSIDWVDGIIDITEDGVQYFINNPFDLLQSQPKGIKFRNEAQKMFEYLKFKNLLK